MSKAEAFNMLKSLGNKVKAMALNLTEIELKVEEATNNDPWGPHGTAMAEITKAAFDLENYKQIMGVVARRLQDKGEDWRHVYKSLLLLEYMLKHGPQKVVEELVSNVSVIEKLSSFQYKDKAGKDWGVNVRQRAKELTNLVMDPTRIRAERSKAKANETKYTGVSSDDMKGGGFSLAGGSRPTPSGFGSSGLGGGGGGGRLDDEPKPRRSNSNGAEAQADPVSATRARIEALKRDGPLPESPTERTPGATIPAVPSTTHQPRLAPLPAPAGKAGPKRLSEIKVNPNIAASLGGFSAAPSRMAAPAPAPAAAGGDSLLGGLDASPVKAPTAAPASAAAPAAPAAAAADVWSSFGGSAAADPFAAPAAPASSAAAADPWGQAPAAAPAASAPADPFAALAAPAPVAIQASPAQRPDPFAPAASSSPAGGAAAKRELPADMFSSPPKPSGMGLPQAMGGFAGPAGAGQLGMPQQQQQQQQFPGMPAISQAAMFPGMLPAGMPGLTAGAMPGMLPAGMPGFMPGSMPGMMPAGMPGGMPGMAPAYGMMMPGQGQGGGLMMAAQAPGGGPAPAHLFHSGSGSPSSSSLMGPSQAKKPDPFADLKSF